MASHDMDGHTILPVYLACSGCEVVALEGLEAAPLFTPIGSVMLLKTASLKPSTVDSVKK